MFCWRFAAANWLFSYLKLLKATAAVLRGPPSQGVPRTKDPHLCVASSARSSSILTIQRQALNKTCVKDQTDRSRQPSGQWASKYCAAYLLTATCSSGSLFVRLHVRFSRQACSSLFVDMELLLAVPAKMAGSKRVVLAAMRAQVTSLKALHVSFPSWVCRQLLLRGSRSLRANRCHASRARMLPSALAPRRAPASEHA